MLGCNSSRFVQHSSRGGKQALAQKKKKSKTKALKHSSNNLTSLASRSVKFYGVFLKWRSIKCLSILCFYIINVIFKKSVKGERVVFEKHQANLSCKQVACALAPQWCLCLGGGDVTVPLTAIAGVQGCWSTVSEPGPEGCPQGWRDDPDLTIFSF